MAAPKADDLDGPAPVRRGDKVYFRHPRIGVQLGDVLCAGRHGFIASSADGRQHKVRHDGYVSHHTRAPLNAQIIEQGEDGARVQVDGKMRFIAGLSLGHLQKADPFVVFDLAKAIKNKPGLVLTPITDKGGHQTKRWESTEADKSGGGKSSSDQPSAGATHGYGTHNIEVGDTLSFDSEGVTGSGRVIAIGKDGAQVRGTDGHTHHARWEEVRAHHGEVAKKVIKPEVLGDQTPVAASKFRAADYAAQHDKGDLSESDILAPFGADIRSMIEQAQGRLQSIEQTIDMHREGEGYSEERRQLHQTIIEHFLNPRTIAAATPLGEKPTLTILGGRGGSGKSWFKGQAYDAAKAIVLDADEIKQMLPEYEGWNAFQVHDESSKLFDDITTLALDKGLNIVHDATMKTPDKAVALVKQFKDAGYRIEVHYMHLPRHQAAKRAVARFLGKTARYVPVDVVLGNKHNEEAFDRVKDMADHWSFRDNNVPHGHAPKLLAEKGVEQPVDMKKSLTSATVLFWRTP